MGDSNGRHEMAGQKSESEILERDTGIEPVSRPWEGRIMPLYESRATL